MERGDVVGALKLRPIYEPSPWGKEFSLLDCDEVLGAGAAGPGKTTVLLMDPLAQIQVEHERCENPNHPDSMDWGDSTGWSLHLRRTLKQLEQSIARTHRIFPKIDPGIKWDAQKNTWRWSSGYHSQFGHCKDRASYEDYMSSEYSRIGFDELVQFEEEQYVQIITRLRSTDPVLSKMLGVRSMSNPLMRMEANDAFTVSDPSWVRTRFVEPWPTGKRVLRKAIEMPDGTTEYRTRMYFPATIDDNPDKLFVKQYKATLSSAPVHIQEALLKGNWYYVPGAYFGAEWDERIHTSNTFKIPLDWPVFRSMDWGFKAPGCIIWWTLDPDGNLFAIRELTFQNKTVDEVVPLIRQIEEDMGYWQGEKSRLTGPADPQIWEQRGDTGLTKVHSFAKGGIRWISGDRSSRKASADRLLERLRDHAHGTKTPGIVFFKNCVKCIRTIPSIPSDPNDREMPMDGGDDHWCDATRYACSYASRGRKGIAQMKPKKEEWDRDEDEPSLPSRHRGNYGYGSEV